MHRHGYKGRKLGREKDQRRALIKGLADSLIINESIETTLPKAKELLPYAEKLITKAKKADLSSRRIIIAKLNTVSAANKLVDEIAPKLSLRTSGHLKIEKTALRRGDNAQLARITFVDDLKASVKPKPVESSKKQKASKPVVKKPSKKVASKKSVSKKDAKK